MIIANIIIIDDDAFVRSSLSAGFKSFGINVAGTATNFLTALEICEKTSIDVAIVDLDLGPGPNGIDICYFFAMSDGFAPKRFILYLRKESK